MALNMDKVRAKLEQFKQDATKSSGSKYFWKPVEGKQTIRIIPNKYTPDFPFTELYFHYLFKKTILSPMTHGNPDPVQEFADKLKKTGSKDDYKEAKKLEPKLRYYAPIVVRDKEDEGVKFWGFGKEVYNELLRLMEDPDYGDITDIQNGIDLTVEMTPKEKTSTNFAQTTVRPKRTSTPAVDTKEQLAKIMDQPEIITLFESPSYDDIKTMLESYLTATPEGEEGKTPIASSNVASVTDVSNSFKKLFEEDVAEK